MVKTGNKMADKEKLEFDGQTVIIDPKNLRFDEATLSIYIQHEAAYYDNFGGALAWAERYLQKKENLHDKVYFERFVEAKESGGSDRLAEAKAKSDPTVTVLNEEVAHAKYIVNRLKQHLRAWDKNHDNAQSMGHMLRKQMDKLNSEINIRLAGIDRSEIPGLDNAIQNTVETEWTIQEVEEDSSGFETNLDIDNLF